MQVSINNSLWRLSVPFAFLTLGCAKHSRWPQYEGIWRGSQPGCGNRQAKRPFWYSWSLLSKREVSELMSSQVGGRGHPEAVTWKIAAEEETGKRGHCSYHLKPEGLAWCGPP